MCNLSEGVEKRGIEKGIEKGIIKTIKILLGLNMREVDIRTQILSEYSITDEKYKEYFKQAKEYEEIKLALE